MLKFIIIILAAIGLVFAFYFIFWHDEADKANPLLKDIVDSEPENQTTFPEEKVNFMFEDKTKIPPPSSMVIEQGRDYIAKLGTTEGDIYIKLNSVATPLTVNNFVYLTNRGFYNDTVFHRTIKDFMIQGGDPTGTGGGGPAYAFKDEPFEGEYLRGTVAMANAGPDTNSSQFFILHKDYPLSKDYVIFGQVIKGIETVDKIAEAPVEEGNGEEMSKPINPARIISARIVENVED